MPHASSHAFWRSAGCFGADEAGATAHSAPVIGLGCHRGGVRLMSQRGWAHRQGTGGALETCPGGYLQRCGHWFQRTWRFWHHCSPSGASCVFHQPAFDLFVVNLTSVHLAYDIHNRPNHHRHHQPREHPDLSILAAARHARIRLGHGAPIAVRHSARVPPESASSLSLDSTQPPSSSSSSSFISPNFQPTTRSRSHGRDGEDRVSGHAGKPDADSRPGSRASLRRNGTDRLPRGAAAFQAHLQPGQAVQTLNDRMKRINKINLEIADWLQVRTR